MINPDDEIHTAVDVIRCVYLARVAAKRGDSQTARRWQAKADAWLGREKPATRPNPLGNLGQLAPEPPTNVPTTRTT